MKKYYCIFNILIIFLHYRAFQYINPNPQQYIMLENVKSGTAELFSQDRLANFLDLSSTALKTKVYVENFKQVTND